MATHRTTCDTSVPQILRDSPPELNVEYVEVCGVKRGMPMPRCTYVRTTPYYPRFPPQALDCKNRLRRLQLKQRLQPGGVIHKRLHQRKFLTRDFQPDIVQLRLGIPLDH